MAIRAQRKPKNKIVKDIERVLKTPVKKREREEFPLERLVDTGSTMLNLACSDTAEAGFPLGKIVNLIGDSSSGKTLLCTTMLALLAHNERFDKHELIYDDAEGGNEFDLQYLFGDTSAKRIQQPEPSATVDDFLLNVCDRLDEGTPFVWVLDSLDALSDEEEQKKTGERQENRKKGRKTETGTYAMGKAKGMSALLRQVTQKIEKTCSLLVVISQTRDNIGVVFGNKKTRSGGRALEFYSSMVVWLSNQKAIRPTRNKRKREVGHEVLAKVTKNRVTGKRREVSFEVLYDYGIDDTTSILNFLIEESSKWGTASRIQTPDDALFQGYSGSMQNVVKFIEENPERLSALKKYAHNLWKEIEEDFKVDRVKRIE